MQEDHTGLVRELELVRDQADFELKEERRKTFTLLQMLESATVKTEADLLKDNQQLVLQLQQSEKEIKVSSHFLTSFSVSWIIYTVSWVIYLNLHVI